jgi:hypothetical protein
MVIGRFELTTPRVKNQSAISPIFTLFIGKSKSFVIVVIIFQFCA